MSGENDSSAYIMAYSAGYDDGKKAIAKQAIAGDFETHPVGTAKRIQLLEAALSEIHDVLSDLLTESQ